MLDAKKRRKRLGIDVLFNGFPMTILQSDTRRAQSNGLLIRRWWVLAALLVACIVMRVIYASVIDLRTDEAYYWTWSKESVLSFLDHPPAIAWLVRFGTAIFGDNNLGARFAGLLAMLATQLLLADIVRRVTHDRRAIILAILMPEAAVYYGLLMAKVAPDVALIPFSVAMVWSLVRVAETGDGRWWIFTGIFAGLALLSKLTAFMLVPAVVAFIVVPDWRRRWLLSPYPWIAAAIAVALFMPVLVWNDMHDWASFQFQFVRAVVTYDFAPARVGEFFGLQFSLVGPVLLPVTLFGVAMTAWRGYRERDGVAILLSTCVVVPFAYFLWRSLTLRIGDTWPMFMWPIGFAATAINVSWLLKQPGRSKLAKSTYAWARIAIVSGLVVVVLTFLYYVVGDKPWLGRTDPGGREAGYQQLASRVQSEMTEIGATWVATTDYRTYAMLRWWLKDRVPVIEVNERARFMGFRDPGMDLIRGHVGLYVALKGGENGLIWTHTSAVKQPVGEVERSWRGIVMDTYVLEKLTNWTPDLSPPPGSPLYRWHSLAENDLMQPDADQEAGLAAAQFSFPRRVAAADLLPDRSAPDAATH